MSDALTVFHQNMQCFKNEKVLGLEVYFAGCKSGPPHFLCITEHWYTEMQVSALVFEDYKLVSKYARRHTIHGGSAIFARVSHEVTELSEVVEKSIEGQLECAAAVYRWCKLVILCVYRPYEGSLTIFFDILSEILNTVIVLFRNYKIILCGDFNVDLLKDSKTSSIFRDLISCYNLNQTINEPTRYHKTGATLIDNIFINFDNPFPGEVIFNSLSDHEGQILRVSAAGCPGDDARPCRYKRILSKAKMDHFKREISQVDWQGVYSSTDVNQGYTIFQSIISQIFFRIFPLKSIKPGKRRGCDKSWITQGIRVSAKNKRRLYQAVLRREIPVDTYRRYSDILKSVIRKAKQWANRDYIKQSKNAGRAIWNLVNKYTGKQPKENDSVLKNLKKVGTESDTALLHRINQFYIDAFPRLNVDYDNIPAGIPKNDKNLFMYPTSPREVHNVVMEMKSKKSVGYDQIPVRVLRCVSGEISGPLAHLANLMLSGGVFPTDLKVAVIKPIHKKGKKDDIKNYRPIALLNTLSKVFEKIVYERIVGFFEGGKLISDRQNGFRKGKSTIRAIYQALERVLESLDRGRDTIAVCLDLSKAFDSVDHQLLLLKLERYGVRGMALNLIESYLTDRTQCVMDVDQNGEVITSPFVRTLGGIPQGSILGPLLYIIYTNEISRLSMDAVQFADDTSIILTSDEEFTNSQVFDTLSVLEAWFSSNNLLLNVEKTQLIKFHYQVDHRPVTYAKNGQSLTTVNLASFLGVNIDHRLSWVSHIDRVAAGIASYCYALRVIATNVSEEAAVIAYHAHVHSRIRYGIVFWAAVAEAERILILQKRCLRNIYNMSRLDSCRDAFRENNILTVTGTYILEAVMFVKENPSLFRGCIRDHDYGTRHKGDLLNIRCNFSYIQKNVKYMIIKIFNHLLPLIRETPSRNLRRYLKGYLCPKAYYSIREFFDDSLHLPSHI